MSYPGRSHERISTSGFIYQCLLFNFLKKYTKKELDEFVCLTLSVLITIDVNPGFTLEKRKLLYLKNGKM